MYAAPAGAEVDGLLVADDALATSTVTGAVAVVPLRRAADLLLRLGSDELLRQKVAAVLVLEGGKVLTQLLGRFNGNRVACETTRMLWCSSCRTYLSPL